MKSEEPAKADATRRFLAEENDHLLLAYEKGQPVGFVSGVEVSHPDKGSELFVYELFVEEAFRRKGIASALLERLAQLAKERGCYDMWMLTDEDNLAALRTYTRAGARDEHGQAVLVWDFPVEPG